MTAGAGGSASTTSGELVTGRMASIRGQTVAVSPTATTTIEMRWIQASHLARSTSPANTDGHEYCSSQAMTPARSKADRGPTSSTGWLGADSPG